MKYPWLVVFGAVLAALGVLFGLQGFDVVGGSPMSGMTLWAIIGPAQAAIGVCLIIVGIRGRKR